MPIAAPWWEVTVCIVQLCGINREFQLAVFTLSVCLTSSEAQWANLKTQKSGSKPGICEYLRESWHVFVVAFRGAVYPSIS